MTGDRGTPSSKRATGELTAARLLALLVLILVLALIVPAVLASAVHRSRVARARAEVQRLATAIQAFMADVGTCPCWIKSPDDTSKVEASAVDLLVGPGNTPEARSPGEWEAGPSDTLANQLLTNGPGYARRTPANPGWAGPYWRETLNADPWGNRYLANVAGLRVLRPSKPPQAVWVLSAGPNGIVETPFDQPAEAATVGGDDVGVRIR